MKKISIIVPCFNSTDTLEEAVESIYTQGLDDFEIVIVDDKSTDNTRDVMQILAHKHPEIKLFHHDKNRGGGATRNTAIRNCIADIIFCLDSDDILAPKALCNMVKLQEKTGADGISVGTSRKFIGNDINLISYVDNFYHGDEPIKFETLFSSQNQPKCGLYSTFLHTKKAFEITGGYPEHHGFDTQSMAFRFLSNGLTAYACKEAEYLHRVKYKRSYYVREHESGKIAFNLYKVYTEFFYLFSEELQKILLTTNFDDYAYPLHKRIEECKNILIPNYRLFTIPYTKNKYKEHLLKAGALNPSNDYWLAEEALNAGDFKNAVKYYLMSLENGLKYPRVFLHLAMALTQTQDYEQVSPFISKSLQVDKITTPPPFKVSLAKKIVRKIRKVVRK